MGLLSTDVTPMLRIVPLLVRVCVEWSGLPGRGDGGQRVRVSKGAGPRPCLACGGKAPQSACALGGRWVGPLACACVVRRCT